MTTTDPLAPSSGSPGSTEVTNATRTWASTLRRLRGTAGTVCAIASVSGRARRYGSHRRDGVSFAVRPSGVRLAGRLLRRAMRLQYAYRHLHRHRPFNFGSDLVQRRTDGQFSTGSGKRRLQLRQLDRRQLWDTMAFGPGTYNVNGSITTSSGPR